MTFTIMIVYGIQISMNVISMNVIQTYVPAIQKLHVLTQMETSLVTVLLGMRVMDLPVQVL